MLLTVSQWTKSYNLEEIEIKKGILENMNIFTSKTRINNFALFDIWTIITSFCSRFSFYRNKSWILLYIQMRIYTILILIFTFLCFSYHKRTIGQYNYPFLQRNKMFIFFSCTYNEFQKQKDYAGNTGNS